MENFKKTVLSKEAKQKIIGGDTDDLTLFNKVRTMTSTSSLVNLKGDEFLALKGKTHRNDPDAVRQ